MFEIRQGKINAQVLNCMLEHALNNNLISRLARFDPNYSDTFFFS